MEEVRDMPGGYSPCFPRATRGWKKNTVTQILARAVSPALRGDGRVPGLQASVPGSFPPRYAGMEGRSRGGYVMDLSFPRATRGWKKTDHHTRATS